MFTIKMIGSSKKYLLSLVMLVCLASSSLWAEEEKSESSGEHEGAAKTSSTQTKMSPLLEVEGKIHELSAKIKSKKSLLQVMIEDKNKLKNNSPELKVKIQDILKEHAELRRLNEEYEKQLNILKYRFPERNAKAKNKYQRFDIKSVTEMEQAMTVDGTLNRNLKKMRSQYGAKTSAPTAPTDSPPLPSAPPAKPSDGSIEDSDAIFLQK